MQWAAFANTLTAWLFVVRLALVASQRGSITVRTGQGSLVGREEVVNGKYVYSFRGIPYAESPTGSARFRPVRPYTLTWSGIKSAQEDGPPCPQPFIPVGRPTYSEDCLHLSVWTSGLGTGGREPAKPVLVYLTGSLFTTDNQLIAPQDLVSSRDLVVVTVSYRLNVLGFLSLENPVLPGNLGLLDQYYALYWVSSNIQYFGGDPAQITLGGSDAGGASALYHSLSARAQPLIKRVISVSGSPLAPWAAAHNPKENALRYIDRVGCMLSSSSLVLECLQRKPLPDIISALEDHLASGNTSAIFAPVEDSFLPPGDQYLGGAARALLERPSTRMAYILGSNTQDGLQVLQFLRRTVETVNVRDLQYLIDNVFIPSSLSRYPKLVNIQMVQELVSQQYFPTSRTAVQAAGTQQEKVQLLESLGQYYTDAFYLAPVQEVAERLAGTGSALHYFVNSRPVRDMTEGSYLNRTQAATFSFLVQLFGPSQFQRVTGTAPLPQDRDISLRIQDAIVPFITRGAPPGTLGWTRYEEVGRAFMELNSLSLGRAYKDKETNFWLSLLPRLNSLSWEFPLPDSRKPGDTSSQVDVYSTLTWLLLAVVLLLLVLLAILWVNARRHSSSSIFSLGTGLPPGLTSSSVCLERSPPRLGTIPRVSRWRESVTNYKM